MRLARILIIAALLVPASTFAEVVISEVMYDLREGSDSGREWIEVYNAGASSIDLAAWKIIENEKSHKITGTQGSFKPGMFAVVADHADKFKIDHPEYSGVLFDSAFSLNNKGETIAIADAAGKEADAVAYTNALGGNGTGDSLQKTSLASGTALAPGAPTPGTDIPSGGLMLTPQAGKTSKKTVTTNTATAAVQPAAVKATEENPVRAESQVAMTIPSDAGSPYLWWLGVFALAACSAFGVLFSRHVRKTEWDIIEET